MVFLNKIKYFMLRMMWDFGGGWMERIKCWGNGDGNWESFGGNWKYKMMRFE
jgi:hypothetical protein